MDHCTVHGIQPFDLATRTTRTATLPDGFQNLWPWIDTASDNNRNMGEHDVHWDLETIQWIAWGSALIIPVKIWLLIRYVRRKMAEDAMQETSLRPPF
ncbi:MAG: hypothetical protein HQM04_14545 [Magnetococcales bacterium]|nr:hypothetical protein [Magnetococcales bacterium]MBF0116244.1 hypothetical protein [Magnetococcales bacterium]